MKLYWLHKEWLPGESYTPNLNEVYWIDLTDACRDFSKGQHSSWMGRII